MYAALNVAEAPSLEKESALVGPAQEQTGKLSSVEDQGVQVRGHQL